MTAIAPNKTAEGRWLCACKRIDPISELNIHTKCFPFDDFCSLWFVRSCCCCCCRRRRSFFFLHSLHIPCKSFFSRLRRTFVPVCLPFKICMRCVHFHSDQHTLAYFECGRMHSTTQSANQTDTQYYSLVLLLFLFVVFIWCGLYFFATSSSSFASLRDINITITQTGGVCMWSVLAWIFSVVFLLWFVWTLRQRDRLHILVTYALHCMRAVLLVEQGENE